MNCFAGPVDVAVAVYECVETGFIILLSFYLEARRFDLRIGQEQEVEIVGAGCVASAGGSTAHRLNEGDVRCRDQR